MRTLFLFILLAFSHGLCYANEISRLPIEAFASLPDVHAVEISPNGERIAYLVRYESSSEQGTMLGIFNLDSGKANFPLKVDNRKYELNWITWANDQHLLISANAPSIRSGVPVTETRLLIFDLEKKALRNILTKTAHKKFDYLPQIQDKIVDLLPDQENAFLWEAGGFYYGIQSKHNQGNAVFKYDLKKNRLKLVDGKIEYVDDYLTDQQGNIRIGVYFKDTTIKILHKLPGKRLWKTLWEFEAFSADAVSPMGFGNDPNWLYVKALYKGKNAIFKVNIQDPSLNKELVYANEYYDVTGSLIHSTKTNEVIGITSADGFWDSNFNQLQDQIDKLLPNNNNRIIQTSADERRYIVYSSNSQSPGTYFFGDRDHPSLKPLAHEYANLDPRLMAPKTLIQYQARDELVIEGFLTLPLDHKEGESHPTIIFPHGGPISYDGKGFDYWTQFFANRGYAVLQMNFRGSSGYGYDFMKAGLQNWGKLMQDDVEDGTRWMINNGYADPDRICIVGASYGGYAALMGTVKTPDLYQCAISFAGVSDVAKLVEENQRYVNSEVIKKQIGSNYKELRAHSPRHNIEQIKTPLLLIHGEKDRVVRVSQTQSMAKALNKANKEFDYIELKDGSHYLSINQNRIATFKAMESFLAEHLGQ